MFELKAAQSGSGAASYVKEVADSAFKASKGYMADALSYGKTAVGTMGTWVADAASSTYNDLSTEKKAALGFFAAGLAGYSVYSWFNTKYMQPNEGFLAFKTDTDRFSIVFDITQNNANNGIHSDTLKIDMLSGLMELNLKQGDIKKSDLLAEITQKPITIKYASNKNSVLPQSVWVYTLTVDPLYDYSYKQTYAYYVVKYLMLESNYEAVLTALRKAYQVGSPDYNQEKRKAENNYKKKKEEIIKGFLLFTTSLELESRYADVLTALQKTYQVGSPEYNEEKRKADAQYRRKSLLLQQRINATLTQVPPMPARAASSRLQQPQGAQGSNLYNARIGDMRAFLAAQQQAQQQQMQQRQPRVQRAGTEQERRRQYQLEAERQAQLRNQNRQWQAQQQPQMQQGQQAGYDDSDSRSDDSWSSNHSNDSNMLRTRNAEDSLSARLRRIEQLSDEEVARRAQQVVERW